MMAVKEVEEDVEAEVVVEEEAPTFLAPIQDGTGLTSVSTVGHTVHATIPATSAQTVTLVIALMQPSKIASVLAIFTVNQ